ncbi:hypothetical protein [Sphaerisporangium sp. TRM90804]|uniref:hypothetical protein n=1 Tax=Sphaerisporangium sp. TRM90804 TaxID=3031113 RepID=UPI00244AED54|nr:hypothetical protein [Sphaerisporangium sp. TRM90804]MDH2426201.1 hypothetical protein [Sphaerisporangium sp. TRM90804]
MTMTDLEGRVTNIEYELQQLRAQNQATAFMAGESTSKSQAAGHLHVLVLRDLKEVRAQQHAHTLTLAEHSKALEGLTERAERLELRFDGLETRFDGLETRFDGLETRFDGLETRFDGLERTVNEHSVALAEILQIVRKLN